MTSNYRRLPVIHAGHRLRVTRHFPRQRMTSFGSFLAPRMGRAGCFMSRPPFSMDFVFCVDAVFSIVGFVFSVYLSVSFAYFVPNYVICAVDFSLNFEFFLLYSSAVSFVMGSVFRVLDFVFCLEFRFL